MGYIETRIISYLLLKALLNWGYEIEIVFTGKRPFSSKK